MMAILSLSMVSILQGKAIHMVSIPRQRPFQRAGEFQFRSKGFDDFKKLVDDNFKKMDSFFQEKK